MSSILPCSVDCVDVVLGNGTWCQFTERKLLVLALPWVVWRSPWESLGQQLNWMPSNSSTGSLAWLQKMTSSDSSSSITKSPHWGSPSGFQEVSTLPSSCPPISTVSLHSSSPSHPTTDPSHSCPYPPRFTHKIYYISSSQEDTCIPTIAIFFN